MTGTTLGPYRVLARLGEGGMGTVYRAHDTKLGRDVALKLLPEAFAADADRLMRFEREARTLAALNHPHIAHVYDAGEHELRDASGRVVRTAFLAMELVEGEDLSARIARGPLALGEALPIAREIAAALDAAHGSGIVHRDLKPANIKLTPDGQVKVLDFGLAKALGAPGAGHNARGTDTEHGAPSTEHAPTMTSPALTAMGVILGTAAYMSPEQARGRAVDKRADIWAFGCVLYEMVTGRRPFAGDDLTETLASLVKDEPDLTAVPVEIRRLIARCLEKDPKKRLRDIGDVWDLVDHTPAAAPASTPTASRAVSRAGWSVAAVSLTLGAALGVLYPRQTTVPRETLQFQVPWPGDRAAGSGGQFFALSPDGRHLALVDQGLIWVRSLDAVEPIRLDRTDGATYPFWSPDGESIAFFAGGELRRIARTGGSVQVITTAAEGRGGAWSSNGTILFSDALGYTGLKRVPAAGGTPAPVTTLSTSGTSDGHRYPQFLPDGERFIYLYLTGDPSVGGVYLGSLDGSPSVRLLDGQDSAVFAASRDGRGGHLLFRRKDALMAQPFDPSSPGTAGAMFPVMQNVGLGANTGLGAMSVSAGGDLAVWVGVSTLADMTWIDRAGGRTAAAAPAMDVDAFALAADGRRLVAALRSGQFAADIWTLAMPNGTPSKFTFGPDPGWSLPLWSHDGAWVAYATFDLAGLAGYEIRRRPSSMTGTEETLVKGDEILFLWDWSPDGRYLVYTSGDDLWQAPVTGDRTPVRLTDAPATEVYGQVSPDGRWLAYSGGSRGATEIYVQPIPATGALWLISTGGGMMPRWRRDGRELYYRANDGRLMAVPVQAGQGTSFQYGTPQPLFGPIPIVGNVERFTYQPAADGSRFLVAVPAASSARPITMVLNWLQAIER